MEIQRAGKKFPTARERKKNQQLTQILSKNRAENIQIISFPNFQISYLCPSIKIQTWLSKKICLKI